jgi:hypothetical protein
MIPTNAADALVINLWGLQASANGTTAVLALAAIVALLILARRLRRR